jgi:peptide deformylase
MAVLPILVAPHPTLAETAAPVAAVTDDIRQLLNDMLETMYAAPGIGLAAPQVGVLQRVIVVDPSDENEKSAPMKLVNPEVIWASDVQTEYQEGCLSVPNQYENVKRPEKVHVRYLDENGAEHTIEAEGLLATVLQHEIDHLDGTLFVDHLSRLKRNMVMRRLQKEQRQKAS